MMTKLAPAVICLAVTLFSCASAQPPIIVRYDLQTGRPILANTQKTLPPPQITFRKPDDSQPEHSQEGKTPQQLADQNLENTTVKPDFETFSGGPVTYDFVPFRQYQIFVAPNQQTDVILQPGEQIMGKPVMGDNKYFYLTNEFSRVHGQPTVNLFLTATVAGQETNITIITDRRTYRFVVSSYRHTYMPIVQYDYRFEDGSDLGGSNPAVASSGPYNQNQIFVYAPIDRLDMNYAILAQSINKPAWAPVMVFNDGTRTYIQFPGAKGEAYAPALFALDSSGRPTLVNYTVRGVWYIVDQVLKKAELVLNKNDGNIITLYRRD